MATMMRRASGVARAKQIKEQSESRRYTPRLKIDDNETVKIWCNGSVEEPRMYLAHSYAKDRAKNLYRTHICAMNDPKAEGCVFCIEHERGNQKLGRATDRGLMNVIDTRFSHYVQKMDEKGKPMRNKKDEPFMVYERCLGKDRCRYCQKKFERTRNGQRLAEFAGKYIEAFVTQIDAISGRCARCWTGDGTEDSGTGTVERVGWYCPECDHDIPLANYDDSPTEEGMVRSMQCPNKKCGKEMFPSERVECSNGCEDAKRVSQFDGPWNLTRAGKGTKTTYSFQFLGVQKMDDALLEYTPLDLDKELKPMSARRMAEELGVKNPLAGAVSGSSETEETETYDSVPDGAEEEENPDAPFAD